MKRVPWDIGLALLAGLGLGLVYAWMISPPHVVDAQPALLRADFKDEYRSGIAAAYEATGNLPRARARLALLGDPDPIEALNAQAQRMLASGASGQQVGRADQVAALALALDDEHANAPVVTPVIEITQSSEDTPAVVPPEATLSEVPTLGIETPEIVELQPTVTIGAPTPRPTRTSIPTAGAPFTLTGQESVCDSNLPDGLLQILVLSSRRRQLAGVEIVITWDGGKEQFFTGLKPELGNGYADYILTPDITYTVQLARGSNVALGIIAPTCQTASGENFLGGIKLTFQQP
jgi:hypothetical protein